MDRTKKEGWQMETRDIVKRARNPAHIRSNTLMHKVRKVTLHLLAEWNK